MELIKICSKCNYAGDIDEFVKLLERENINIKDKNKILSYIGKRTKKN